MQLPPEFYTQESLLTLAGSATAVWLATSVVGYLFSQRDTRNLKKWLGLVLSMVLALLGASLLEEKSLSTWVAAVFNGFLIYLTAVGANTITSQTANQARREDQDSPIRQVSSSKKRGGFRDPWW